MLAELVLRGPDHDGDFKSGTDPASKAGGGRFQYHVVVKSHYGFITVREMKYTSQHCCDITMDVKMALYRECCFPNCRKSW